MGEQTSLNCSQLDPNSSEYCLSFVDRVSIKWHTRLIAFALSGTCSIQYEDMGKRVRKNRESTEMFSTSDIVRFSQCGSLRTCAIADGSKRMVASNVPLSTSMQLIASLFSAGGLESGLLVAWSRNTAMK